ncbi:response regulator [uncultured Sphingomonas sp.]|uniref:response regulator n=1 Tax=uncultured Sphingomonas sp. TaxID=158754 RepID=UPI0035CA40AF
MSDDHNISLPEGIGVSLVDGNPAVRHARQLMLRSEKYDVRSYPTCAAILADPRSRDCPCIILDLDMDAADGVDLLRQMRASGWRGKALLLHGLHPESGMLHEAERHGDRVLQHDVGDRTLLAAIAASIDYGWAGWNARG